MAEISMVQMTGPAVSPGASVKEAQGSQTADFSDLLRDKGQSVSDGVRKPETKKPEKEQSQAHKPDQKVTAQEDEKQEADESASSLENTEEGLSVLAGLLLQQQQVQETDVATAEKTVEAAPTEPVLSTENVEAVQVQRPETPPVTMTDVQTAAPVQEAVQAVQSQDMVQTRQTAAPQETTVRSETQAESPVEQPRQVAEAVKPEQPRQENQTETRNQGEMEAEAETLKEAETTATAEEQPAAQSSAAAGQLQAQPVGEGEQMPAEAGTVKTSEATMHRDIAETLATRMPSENGELTLELEPASLGKIIIKVAFENGKTVMSLMADSSRTLSILSQRAGEMAQILEEKTGQQTVIYTPENQPSQEDLPERGGEENRQRQRDAQEENRHDKGSESFMQQLRLGLVG